MMGGLSLSFGAPLVLAGLLALPVIWWLLKLTPPRPQTEAFPPLRILQRVLADPPASPPGSARHFRAGRADAQSA